MPRRKRCKFELWVDKYNHILELVRTVFNLFAFGATLLVLLRVYGVI